MRTRAFLTSQATFDQAMFEPDVGIQGARNVDFSFVLHRGDGATEQEMAHKSHASHSSHSSHHSSHR